jgi:DNA replication protein DnaC
LSQRYSKTSIIITNRGVGAWGEILGYTTAAETLRRTTTGTRQQLH